MGGRHRSHRPAPPLTAARPPVATRATPRVPPGGRADVERLREIVRLRDLLGLPLEELSALVEAEDARAALRREVAALEEELRAKRRLLEERLGGLGSAGD